MVAALITGLFSLAAAFVGGAYAGPRIGIVVAEPTVTITANPTGTITTSPTPGAGKELFTKNNVQLTSGYALSFNDPSFTPFSTGGCTSADLSICNGAFVGSSAQLADFAGRAGFSGCEADTDYVSGATDFQTSLVGTTLCVTTADRIAACYVNSDTTQDTSAPVNGLTMDCTVFAAK